MADEFSSYDEVPYVGRIHSQSHIEVAATIGRLFGLNAADPQRCRVLEIGCADGTNLATMAYHLPDSEFVGIDGAKSQIELGQKLVDALSLSNVELLAMDLREIGPEMGAFDYIIAHGIFSWIADDARHAMLQVCRDRLKPDGIAYISYNCYPGWHLYEQLRGIMRFHSRGMSSTKQEIEQARAIINFMGTAIVDTDSPRAEFFRDVVPSVLRMSDDYLYHEYLEVNNKPMYFHEFIAMAMVHGMQYLGETAFYAMMSANYPEAVRDTLDRISHNILELEQYMDFLRNRRFRCTLLCHREVGVERSVGLDPIVNFRIGFRYPPDDPDHDLRSDDPLQYTSPDNEETAVIVQDPVHKVALSHLVSHAPASVPFRAVADHCAAVLGREADVLMMSELADLFMKLYTQSLCEFHVFQPPVTGTVAKRPIASRLARYQAYHSRIISSQLHEMVQLGDNQSREVLARLDGTRTVDDLVADLLPMLPDESRAQLDDPASAMRASIEMILRRLARQGVLIPAGAE